MYISMYIYRNFVRFSSVTPEFKTYETVRLASIQCTQMIAN